MKSKPILVAAAIALLAMPAAGAEVRQPAPGVAAAQSGPKHYAKNAATGDYRLLHAQGVRTSSLAGTTSETTSCFESSSRLR